MKKAVFFMQTTHQALFSRLAIGQWALICLALLTMPVSPSFSSEDDCSKAFAKNETLIEGALATLRDGWVYTSENRYMRTDRGLENLLLMLDESAYWEIQKDRAAKINARFLGPPPSHRDLFWEVSHRWNPNEEAEFRAAHGLPISLPSADIFDPKTRSEWVDVKNWHDKKIIDLGTGDGKMVFDLRDKGVDATGLDIVLTSRQKEHPYFVEADIRNTGLLSETYDVAISAFNIFHYGNSLTFYEQAVPEIIRILKPGGIFIILDANLSAFDGLLTLLKSPELELLSAPPNQWRSSNNNHLFRKRL